MARTLGMTVGVDALELQDGPFPTLGMQDDWENAEQDDSNEKKALSL